MKGGGAKNSLKTLTELQRHAFDGINFRLRRSAVGDESSVGKRSSVSKISFTRKLIAERTTSKMLGILERAVRPSETSISDVVHAQPLCCIVIATARSSD